MDMPGKFWLWAFALNAMLWAESHSGYHIEHVPEYDLTAHCELPEDGDIPQISGVMIAEHSRWLV